VGAEEAAPPEWVRRSLGHGRPIRAVRLVLPEAGDRESGSLNRSLATGPRVVELDLSPGYSGGAGQATQVRARFWGGKATTLDRTCEQGGPLSPQRRQVAVERRDRHVLDQLA
jgi:hypothetical protein